jgi:hypothetical protein
MGTTRIPRDFREFLKLLVAHDSRFLLISGYAVNAFGYVRNTLDIDIWIAADSVNQRRIIQAVREFGFPSATEDLLAEPDAMLRMGVPPLRIEVMKSISGVEFEDCWARRVVMEDEGLEIPIISLADLRTNKLASGRPKDLLASRSCLNAIS